MQPRQVPSSSIASSSPYLAPLSSSSRRLPTTSPLPLTLTKPRKIRILLDGPPLWIRRELGQ